jgi:ketosteroid isomerase-like protein
MPRGNVEVVRTALEAWGRRDSPAIRELFDEQAEVRSAIVGGIEGGIYRGHDGIERYFSDLDEALEDWHTEDEHLLDVGGDKVVLLYRTVGHGKGSGVPVDQPVGIVFTLGDARVLRCDVYLDSQDALKAGLQHTFETVSRGDVNAAVDNLDPDIEWEHQIGTGAPEEGTYRGREEVRHMIERVRDAWEDIRVDVQEVADAGDQKYAVRAVMKAKGKMSEVPLESACEYVLAFRDSKVVHLKFSLSGPAPRPTREPSRPERGATAA